MELPNNIQAAKIREALRDELVRFDAEDFEALALRVFRYQAVHNPIYARYLGYLGIPPEQPRTLLEVPFLPISLFKQHQISTGKHDYPNTQVFESSGTTGVLPSRHWVPDMDLYRLNSTRIFEAQYGPLDNFHILALLPSYLERNNSSLVYMVQDFIQKSGSHYANFYLNDRQAMARQLRELATLQDGKKVLLIGVTFALLDWAESSDDRGFLADLPALIVMETGGMKGRRKELLREEVHEILKHRLGVGTIHSEYGMTELLSQAYSQGDGLFRSGYSMRIIIRDPNDPFTLYASDVLDQTGGINVVDLANIDSCAFIETQDLGRYGSENETFYVVGRFDNSDIRGCNLMLG